MNDEDKFSSEADFTRLEKILSQFQAAPLPTALRTDLQAAAPNHRARRADASPLADNLLALWTLGGALAACIVIALTASQLTSSPRPAPPTSQTIALHEQTMQEMERLIASR